MLVFFVLSESLYLNPDSESTLNVSEQFDTVESKTEASEGDTKFPFWGSCFDDTKPNQDMADPFYEEFLDLGNLYPELDAHPIQLLPDSCLSDFLPKKEELTPSSIDFMNDLDKLLEEADFSNINSDAVSDLLNVEVIDEAPVMQEQTESWSSSCVSSPGSVTSVDSRSTATSVYPSTAAQITSIEATDLHQLLELLNADPATNTCMLEIQTVDATEIAPVTSSVVTGKHKLDTSDEEQGTRKPKTSKSVIEGRPEKATERRVKNNTASRYCRASRKKREHELFAKEEELLKSNSELKAQVEELTKETEALRKILVQRLSSTN